MSGELASQRSDGTIESSFGNFARKRSLSEILQEFQDERGDHQNLYNFDTNKVVEMKNDRLRLEIDLIERGVHFEYKI